MCIIEKLTPKWGEGNQLNNCWAQKRLDFISKDARLNILFNPIFEKEMYWDFFKSANCTKLLHFYNSYNGCKLFSNSLCIYGIQEHSSDLYQIYDLEWENMRLNAMMHKLNYIYFGSLGGQYVFALKKNSDDETVYCFNADNGFLVKKIENFDVLFSTLFNNLYDEYDAEGIKIHKNRKYKNIKSLYNTTIEKDFLEEK